MNVETEVCIEREFEECATLLDVAKKYAEIITSLDCLAQNRINGILIERDEEERRVNATLQKERE